MSKSGSNMVLSKRLKNGGFTLVEVLSAVLLLSVGLLAVLTADRAAQETQLRATYLSIGRNIAQSKIDDLRSASIDSIASSGPDADPNLPKGNQVTVTVSPYPYAAEGDLRRAVVTVTWPEKNGTRKVCYETLITRN